MPHVQQQEVYSAAEVQVQVQVQALARVRVRVRVKRERRARSRVKRPLDWLCRALAHRMYWLRDKRVRRKEDIVNNE